jgi:hypothetical protein
VSPASPAGAALSPQARRILTLLLVLVVSGVLGLAFLPLAWWAGCLFFAFRVWRYVGHWPYYGHPDAGQLPREFGSIPSWADSLFSLLVLVALVATGQASMRRWLPKRWWLWAAVLSLVVLWAGVWGLALLDPGGLLEWGFD